MPEQQRTNSGRVAARDNFFHEHCHWPSYLQFSATWPLPQPLVVWYRDCRTTVRCLIHSGCQLCQSGASLPEQTASFFFQVNYSLYLLSQRPSHKEIGKDGGEFECPMDWYGFQENKALLGCSWSLRSRYPSQLGWESLHHKLFGLQPNDINSALIS